jgi:hypothetical protein
MLFVDPSIALYNQYDSIDFRLPNGASKLKLGINRLIFRLTEDMRFQILKNCS